MAITLELSPETETRLIAQANAQGISVEQLLKNTIEVLLATSSSTGFNTRTNSDATEEWVRAFTDWANSHSTDTPLLSDQAVSRESIYRDREDAQR
ncbi:hypothetical protein ACQ4M3_38315 [Leptolyngbya sp. AN03gr2]|uniref:hypothetical protein n=1 Tax=unclassified Leptolyngbya TaxID=2650499 RepID=UPI003D31063F